MDGSPDLEYLQFSFSGHQTVYTIACHLPGSDRLFAKRRRLLVIRMRMTHPHENRYYCSGRIFSNNINWSRRQQVATAKSSMVT